MDGWIDGWAFMFDLETTIFSFGSTVSFEHIQVPFLHPAEPRDPSTLGMRRLFPAVDISVHRSFTIFHFKTVRCFLRGDKVAPDFFRGAIETKESRRRFMSQSCKLCGFWNGFGLVVDLSNLGKLMPIQHHP